MNFEYIIISEPSSGVNAIRIEKYELLDSKNKKSHGYIIINAFESPTANCQVLGFSSIETVINFCRDSPDEIRTLFKKISQWLNGDKKFILFDVYSHLVPLLTKALGEPYTISSYKSQYDWDIQMSMGLYWIPGKSEDDYEGDEYDEDND